MLEASNQGLPAIRMKGADVSEAYSDVIGRFLGETVLDALPMRRKRLLQAHLQQRQLTRTGPGPDALLQSQTQNSSVAKDRLQLILAHERIGRNANGTAIPDFLPQLQKDLIAVLSKYVKISDEDVKINVKHQDKLDHLEVKRNQPLTTARPGGTGHSLVRLKKASLLPGGWLERVTDRLLEEQVVRHVHEARRDVLRQRAPSARRRAASCTTGSCRASTWPPIG